MKKLIAAILCVVMVISLLPMSAFAASGTLVREEELAKDLKALGIFKGVSETDFALDRAPTRTEALVMLIRVLGRESDALSKGGRHPFLDVPQWADKYVGYAYENNLTNGVSATKFGSNSIASASMYLTFVLRALGYSDSNGDFTWDNPFALARQTGIMRGNPDVMKFLRADVVLVSYAALEAQIKGSRNTLAQKLIEAGVFTAEAYDRYYNVSEFENEGTVTNLTSEEIYKKCSPAVFYIEVYNENGKAFATGSGFFIKADGTAVTNYHVIEGAHSAKIRRSDTGKVYKVEGVYDYSKEEDWAVIKIEGENFPYLEIEKEEKVTGGQTVYAIGSPLGLENTISEGLVSNVNRVLGGVPFIQISVPISHGSSGGALINKKGKVIGITSAGFDEGQNLNLALPISIIDGYNMKTTFPIWAAGEFEEEQLAVGDVDVSGLSEAEAATEILRAWIVNNENIKISGIPAYCYESKDSNGTTLMSILFEEEYGFFMIFNDFFFDDGSRCSSYVYFYPEKEIAGAEYEYFEANSKEPNTSEQFEFRKSDFHENMNIPFTTYFGSYENRQIDEANARTLFFNAIDFVDWIINDELDGYNLDGAGSFGFDYFAE